MRAGSGRRRRLRSGCTAPLCLGLIFARSRSIAEGFPSGYVKLETRWNYEQTAARKSAHRAQHVAKMRATNFIDKATTCNPIGRIRASYTRTSQTPWSPRRFRRHRGDSQQEHAAANPPPAWLQDEAPLFAPSEAELKRIPCGLFTAHPGCSDLVICTGLPL